MRYFVAHADTVCANVRRRKRTANKNHMEAKDLMELQALDNMNYNKHHGKGWSMSTALWVIAAVIVIAFVFWGWQRGCNDKQETAVAVARLEGRVAPIEVAVTQQGNNLFSLNGVVSATVQGVGDLKECVNEKIDVLANQVLFQRRGRGCCNDGNRVFNQRSTYNLASQEVTVDESCGGCRS